MRVPGVWGRRYDRAASAFRTTAAPATVPVTRGYLEHMRRVISHMMAFVRLGCDASIPSQFWKHLRTHDVAGRPMIMQAFTTDRSNHGNSVNKAVPKLVARYAPSRMWPVWRAHILKCSDDRGAGAAELLTSRWAHSYDADAHDLGSHFGTQSGRS